MNTTLQQVRLHVWGEYACFTRPEMKVERVSYDVMTPSAARGILEAVLWKPAIRWEVTRIDVLRPIRWISVRRNEVGSVASTRNALAAMHGGGMVALYVEEARQQRAGLLLHDVGYVIHARFKLTDRAGPGDNPAKFADMFRRRAESGQCFNQPYLGCREFSASFSLVPPGEPGPQPIEESRDLGWMLHDVVHENGAATPRFFRARLEDGSLPVPPLTAAEVHG